MLRKKMLKTDSESQREKLHVMIFSFTRQHAIKLLIRKNE